MEKIASFTVNHDTLEKGVYISRIDGDAVTYDLRMKKPNNGSFISPKSLHTIEHLGATYLRNSKDKGDVVYFGPMGCRTGCYLVMFGDLDSEDVLNIVLDMCDFIIGFEGEIPGAKPEECGNYSEQNLNMAKYYISRYRKDLTEKRNLKYGS